MRERNFKRFTGWNGSSLAKFELPKADFVAKGPPLMVAPTKQLRVGALHGQPGAGGEQHIRWLVLEFSDQQAAKRWNPLRYLHEKRLARMDAAVWGALNLFTSPSREGLAA